MTATVAELADIDRKLVMTPEGFREASVASESRRSRVGVASESRRSRVGVASKSRLSCVGVASKSRRSRVGVASKSRRRRVEVASESRRGRVGVASKSRRSRVGVVTLASLRNVLPRWLSRPSTLQGRAAPSSITSAPRRRCWTGARRNATTSACARCAGRGHATRARRHSSTWR